MDYSALEAELCEALTAAGWIESVRADRNNDSWIEWTAKGKAHHPDFEASVQEILDYRSGERRAFLREFALYHRLAQPTRRESIERRVRWLIPKSDFLLVVCAPDGSSRHYLYTPPVDDRIYETIDAADAAGNEVLFIELSDLAKAPVPRTTPLGAKGFWERAGMGAVQLGPFDELIAGLRAHGLVAAADSLARLKASAWTSSSEMIGELGLAVLRLQSGSRRLPDELTPVAERCMKEARKIWPDIKLS